MRLLRRRGPDPLRRLRPPGPASSRAGRSGPRAGRPPWWTWTARSCCRSSRPASTGRAGAVRAVLQAVRPAPAGRGTGRGARQGRRCRCRPGGADPAGARPHQQRGLSTPGFQPGAPVARQGPAKPGAGPGRRRRCPPPDPSRGGRSRQPQHGGARLARLARRAEGLGPSGQGPAGPRFHAGQGRNAPGAGWPVRPASWSTTCSPPVPRWPKRPARCAPQAALSAARWCSRRHARRTSTTLPRQSPPLARNPGGRKKINQKKMNNRGL